MIKAAKLSHLFNLSGIQKKILETKKCGNLKVIQRQERVSQIKKEGKQ